MKKATITFFPNELKQNQKTKKTPIYIRVIYDRQKSESRLNCEIPHEQLILWNPITMRLNLKANGINQFLSSLENKFEKLKITNDYNLDMFTAHTIKSYLLGEGSKQKPLLVDYVRNYFSKSVQHNSQFVDGTKRNYTKSINHLCKFLELTGRSKMFLRDLKAETIFEFKDYLLKDSPERKGMTEVSASSIFKKLKPIIERASQEGHIERNPFKGVKLKSKSPRRERLTILQVKAIHDLKLDPSSALNLYRDYFLFSVFTGLAYKDLVGLRKAELMDIGNNNICIERGRAKTDVFTQVVLVQQAKAIIDKYSGHHETMISGKVLPTRTDKEYNLQLKVIAEKSDIYFRLTTHIARHTFRQLISEAGIEDYAIIKRMMGQSRNGDVDEVYYSVTHSKLIEAKERFQIFLNKYLCYDI